MTKMALDFLSLLSACEIENDLAELELLSDNLGVMRKESDMDLRIRCHGPRCEIEPYCGVGLCSGSFALGAGGWIGVVCSQRLMKRKVHVCLGPSWDEAFTAPGGVVRGATSLEGPILQVRALALSPHSGGLGGQHPTV